MAELSAKENSYLHTPIGELPYVIFDMEMTGGNPRKNTILEICGLRYCNGKQVGSFHKLINPQRPVPPILRRITGINQKMVANAPILSEVLPEFLDFIQDSVLVSHNVQSDLSFLHYYAHKMGQSIENFYLCTHLLATKLMSEAPKKHLKGLCDFLGFDNVKAHRAQGDALMTHHLFSELQSRLVKHGCLTLMDAIREQGDYSSLSRIGWLISSKTLKALLHAPAVFSLYDTKKHLLLRGCSPSLNEDMHKVGYLEVLPRSLQRRVYYASDIAIQYTDNVLEAFYFDMLQKDFATYQKQHYQFCDNFVLQCKCVEGGCEVFLGVPHTDSEWIMIASDSVSVWKYYMRDLQKILHTQENQRKHSISLQVSQARLLGKIQAWHFLLQQQQQHRVITQTIPKRFKKIIFATIFVTKNWFVSRYMCLRYGIAYAVYSSLNTVVKKYVGQVCDIREFYGAVVVQRLDAKPSKLINYVYGEYGIPHRDGVDVLQESHATGYEVYPIFAGELQNPFFLDRQFDVWLQDKEGSKFKKYITWKAKQHETSFRYTCKHALRIGTWIVRQKPQILERMRLRYISLMNM